MDWAGLNTALMGWIRKPEAEQEFPNFIAFAEAKMSRILAESQLSGPVWRADATISSEYYDVPLDLAIPLTMTLSTGEVLENTSEAALQNLRADENAQDAKPRLYAVVGRQFRFYPAPDQAYSAELVYQSTIAALNATNTTNWLIDSYPDAYLYGALVQAGAWVEDDKRLSRWQTMFDAAMAEVVKAESAKLGQPTTKLRTDLPTGRRPFNILTG